MALQNNGRLTLSQIAAEFGGSAPHKLSEYYGSDSVPASGRLKMSDFYGTSAMSYLTLAGGQDVNLETFITSQGLSSGAVTVTVTDHVSASSTAVPALQSGDLSAFDQVILAINPSVMVVGRGGNGGRGGGTGAGSPGGAGGTAIILTTPLHVDNRGAIYGGGGGGGGAGRTSRDGDTRYYGSGGGGGGIGGSSGGAGGIGQNSSSNGYAGGAGSLTSAGGGGGAQSSSYGRPGGSGGSYGVGGAAGQHTSTARPGGAGGAAGKALVGNTFVTWITQGTTAGAVE